MGCAASHGAADQQAVDATRGLPTTLKQAQLGGDGSSPASVLQRAAAANLPERLTLGLTLAAMEGLLASIPSDIVDQCNAAIPKNESGQPRFPANTELNGYVNQFHAAQAGKQDGLSTCERLHQQGAAGVGVANVFVSWYLQTPLTTLFDALRQYLLQHPGLPLDTTRFWVCDFAIRQANASADVARLGDCVRAIGHTVLLMEPWYDPMPLRRAYCVKEVYHTQASGAHFDVVMSEAQQAAFERALVKDFESIQTQLSKVDVRQAECRNKTEQEAILGELYREVGLMECNRLVFELLRSALATQGRAALDRLPAEECGTSALMNNLGRLLQAQGDLTGAEVLLREALKACRETLGDRHIDTLTSISNLGALLSDQGDLEGAEVLLREALQARRETLGDRHKETLTSINNLAMVLQDKSDLAEADVLHREALQACRETLGDRHMQTLGSISNLGLLLQDQGDLAGAEVLFREALQAFRETLGGRHMSTLTSMNNLGLLLQHQGDLAGAEVLHREALRTRRETLGDRHIDTLTSISNLGSALKAQGNLAEAEVLAREALQAQRETLGDGHMLTLTSINNLATLLQAQGNLAGAEVLFREGLQASRETLGDRHMHTLGSVHNLGTLLQDQGDLAGAELLYREALQAERETLGNRHMDTLGSIFQLSILLYTQGKSEDAKQLVQEAVTGARETLGDEHPMTQNFLSNPWGIR